jgi:Uma2 family endonuclease
MATQTNITVNDLSRMVDAGVLPEDARVELVDGEVRQMAPIGSRHGGTVNRLNIKLRELGNRFVVGIQNPIDLDLRTQLHPDVSICKPRDDVYFDSNPTPSDTLLVIEVADSSSGHDRSEKIPRYAQADIPEAWIVDVDRQVIEQYLAPDGIRYAAEKTFHRGDILTSQAVEGLQVRVEEIV